MSFLKGKNVENLRSDGLEAMRYNATRQKIRELFETARVTRKDIQEMVETGELTEEEARQEQLELIREVNKEKHRIESSFAERHAHERAEKIC